MKRILTLTVTTAFVAVALVPTVLASEVKYVTDPAVTGVKCETVKVPMRDGTLLSTDVYLPTVSGPYPVLLERNPYVGLAGGCFVGPAGLVFSTYAQHGYVDVVQAVRGTGLSQGKFNPVIQEVNDGYDAVEWAAAQSWSTGRVGMTSGSYLGIVQLLTAIASPPHLYAINPHIASSDPHDNPVYENGVFRLSDFFQYASGFAVDDITREGAAKGLPPGQIARQIAAFEASFARHLKTRINTIPLLSTVRPFEPFVESHFYETWLKNQNYDAYWNAQDTETHFANIKVPALIGGASDDLFNIGAVRNYQGMRNFAGTAAARRGTKIYWQAYGHPGDSGTPTFGNDTVPWATGGNPLFPDSGLAGEQLAFFDHYLKGINNGYENSPNANIYVLVPPDTGETGSGFWLGAADFPIPGTKEYIFYLGSNGHANSRLGDGYMVSNRFHSSSTGEQVGPSSDQYTYDPSNPVPTVGGNLLEPDALGNTLGFMDQSAVELRKDVLVYTSAPLTENLPVIGTVGASFWAITSAADTDFTVKLVDVHPDGVTNNVVDRVVRSRFRLGSKLPPSFITPNTPYQYQLEVGNTAMIFPKGHRLRVEISSSNFPKFARNLNTTQANDNQGQYVVAHQTLLHDVEHPSLIELPVAPGVQVP